MLYDLLNVFVLSLPTRMYWFCALFLPKSSATPAELQARGRIQYVMSKSDRLNL